MDEATRVGLEASLKKVAQSDVEGILVGEEEYDRSWMKDGGVGAWFTMKRCLDRLPVLVSRKPSDSGDRFDIFQHVLADKAGTGVLDSVRDMRRYCMLVEAELVRQGHNLPPQRHNDKRKQ